jgi:prepilin-type N-terminal cleavage/methylation domain-containing protein
MSYQTKRINHREGFTLIELLIVILIVSMVYFLGFSDIETEKKKPKALTPLNLKMNIISSENFHGKMTLLCVNKCKTCLLRPDISSAYRPYSHGIDLTNIKAYTVDSRNSLVQIEYERYDDKKVCLKMDFYPNGSSTQIILENEKGAYFLPTYFEEAKKFESPEDAKDYWLENTQLVSDNGEFY